MSGALISATSPGLPAALTSFGARPKRAPPSSCSASLVSLAAVTFGASSEALKPSVIGHWATAALHRRPSAASVIACPPPNEEPNRPTRSIPGRPRACSIAIRQSASWVLMSNSWRGSPPLAPKWR